MAYTRVNWQNSPSHATPLSAENLNVMDAGIASLDTAVTEATGDISTLETEVGDQATTISGLQTTVGEHTTDIQNAQDDISGLQTTVSGHTTSIGNLQTAVGINTEDITDVKEDLENEVTAREEADTAINTDLARKANVDGAYDNMTVGNAEQLVSTVFVEDSTPYKFRTTGESVDVGDREYVDAIVGGTVAWNQLAGNNARGISDKGILATYDSSTHMYHFANTATGESTTWLDYVDVSAENHKLLAMFSNSNLKIYANSSISTNNGVIFNSLGPSSHNYIGIRIENGKSYNYDSYLMCIDLTQLFGSTIADYIYSLEQANAGAGVAWFKKLFPKDYYEYNEGELISISGLQSHDMIGFNQWDEDWENGYINNNGTPTSDASSIRSKNFNRCIPNAVYYFEKPSSYAVTPNIVWYDANKEFISRSTDVYPPQFLYTSPSNASFFKISCYQYGSTYNHDICINFSWDGERDGEYEPYVKHSYALDDSLTLRGIPKLDASNQLYYDGDRYLPSGEVERRYGVVDLGSLNWTASAQGGYSYYSDQLTNALPVGNVTSANVVCGKYEPYFSGNGSSLNDKTYRIGGTYIGTQRVSVRDDAYSTVSAFKTAMSGVYLVYELATPTTETAESYNRTQICDDFGTEEFISDSIVPVGHETKYANNLRAKLEMAPNSPDGDGDYIVRQTNGENTYVPLEKELPTAPTTDGSYVLKCTVSGGTATYTWESD